MRFDSVTWPGELRPYQVTALDRLAERWNSDQRRAWVVLPPGAGKTLVGLEAARRLHRTIVAFTPNTAIQSQWLAHWRACGGAASTSRRLRNDLTVLTYQSLAVFDPDAETDEEGHDHAPGRGLVDRLHPNGRALVAALRDAGPLTLVLDECHHLLDVWGRLLAEVLEELPDAVVIGLTATPPGSLTAEEATLVDLLFGEPIVGASVPALIRRGYLAPCAELAWLTTPTGVEGDYIGGEATRFTELTTDLLAPGFASTDFLAWVDARLVELGAAAGEAHLSWEWVERTEPDLAAAALRLHHAGLLALPPGARPREEHRHAPTAEDWVVLLNDYVRHCLLPSTADRDAAAVEAIRRALPAVGYQLTRRGIRSSRSPVDRVLARSAAKTHGAVEIAAAEADTLGERLRCLVLCDHERATATLPAGLRAVLDPQAGAARLVLESLVADERTAALRPMLVTGRTVAAAPATARAFLDFVAAEAATEPAAGDGPELAVEPLGADLAEITGPWTSRHWVPRVTAFFEAGGCQILVGTRGLLGEGWDARGINCLIDLTTATTPTAVVQTRGRALRLDPAWKDKTATTWTVVCVTEEHPKGAADWDRFVRKHDGYLVAAPDGEIVAGVAHVDAAFSPYAPPPTATFDGLNAQMLARAHDRDATRTAWQLDGGYRDELVHTIRVRATQVTTARETEPSPDTTAPLPPAVVPAAHAAHPVPEPPPRVPPRGAAGPLRRAYLYLLLAAIPALALYLAAGARETWHHLLLGLLATALVGYRVLVAVEDRRVRRRRAQRQAADLLASAADGPAITHLACAVADGLAECELSPRGAEAVTVRPEPDGSYRLSLAGVDTATSRRFTEALDEVLAPIATPRYLIPRHVVRHRHGPEAREHAQAWLDGQARSDGVVYHAVPAELGQNRTRVARFETAWHRWVSDGRAVYTSSAEGTGLLAAHRGEDPIAATTAMRLAWE